jgi:hypothetical protein
MPAVSSQQSATPSARMSDDKASVFAFQVLLRQGSKHACRQKVDLPGTDNREIGKLTEG